MKQQGERKGTPLSSREAAWQARLRGAAVCGGRSASLSRGRPTCPGSLSRSLSRRTERARAGGRAYLRQLGRIVQDLLCMKVIQPEPGSQVGVDLPRVPQQAAQRRRAAAGPCKGGSKSRSAPPATGVSPPGKNGFSACKGNAGEAESRSALRVRNELKWAWVLQACGQRAHAGHNAPQVSAGQPGGTFQELDKIPITEPTRLTSKNLSREA